MQAFGRVTQQEELCKGKLLCFVNAVRQQIVSTVTRAAEPNHASATDNH
jgi:hypothetical protein